MRRLGRGGIALLSAWSLLLIFSAASAKADVFPDPGIAGNDLSMESLGKKRALFYIVHDRNNPLTTPEWDARVLTLRDREQSMRAFFAENSGGKIDFDFDPVIVDAAIPLNFDGTRPSNWRTLANNIATGTYGLNLDDYFTLTYDLNSTNRDPGQAWAGRSIGTRVQLQTLSQRTFNHEFGHQAGVGHARALNPNNNSNSFPYYWDESSNSYKEYLPGISPYTAVPFGVPSYEYGNPYDIMGNIGAGHFNVRAKTRFLKWLPEANVPDLNELGEGTYKIYAHDELEPITDAQGNHGVAEDYHPDLFYGLTYERPAQEYDITTNTFLNTTQEIHLEYRSGYNGVGFYLDGQLVHLDPAGDQSHFSFERLLMAGNSAEDVDFGMSTLIIPTRLSREAEGVDFLSLNPPPPSLLTDEWFRFAVLGTGSDAFGSYAEVQVSRVLALNGIAGDLDQSGVVDSTDLDLFVAGWQTNTAIMDLEGKYRHGDMSFDGITNLQDAYLFHEAWAAAGGAPLDLASLLGETVPEPSSLALLLAVTLLPYPRSRKARCCG